MFWKRQSVDENPFFSSTMRPPVCYVLRLLHREAASVLVMAFLNRLRVVSRLRPLGPATVSDDLAAGFQQPVPRHRRYNYSVHHERESSSFSGRPSCKEGVDSDAQLIL